MSPVPEPMGFAMRDMAEGERARARKMLCSGGYKGGGEIKEMKTIARRAIHEHEVEKHEGKPTHLKLKSGGAVHGNKSEGRPDRKARGGSTEERREDESDKLNAGHMKQGDSGEMGENEGRARGGGAEKKGKSGGKSGHTQINIAIGNPEKEQMAHQQGMQEGAKAIVQKLAGAGAGGPPPGAGGPPPGGPPPGMARPPMAGPPPGGPPPGAPPPGAMMPHARGGGVHRDMGGPMPAGGMAPAAAMPPATASPPMAPAGMPVQGAIPGRPYRKGGKV